MGSMTDAATCVEEFGGLIRDMYLHPEVVGVEIVDDLVGEVVHIDHDAGKALRLQFSDDVSQQRFPATGTSALGIRSVSGFRRVPSPAANIIACFVM